MASAETPPPLFGDYYRGIYAKGLTGERPTLPMAWAELESRARESLDERAIAYIFGGAGSEDTMRANLDAFRRWRIVPRVLRDLSRRDLSTTVLGTEMPAPVLLAPIGVQKVLHDEGELASARAAAALGLPLITSTASATAMEEIAEASGEGPRWFQLYWPNDDELAASFVRRAEAAGYGAIVVTVDNFIPGWKPRDLQQAYLPFLEGIGIAQYLSDPVFLAGLEKSPEEDLGAAVGHFLGVFANPNVTWERLEWLRGTTSLPIVLKGILHPDDAARRASAASTASSSPTTAAARSTARSPRSTPCRRSSRRSATSWRSCSTAGIRSGADIVKALALGADAVLLGRPYLWGLALDGQAGVETVLRSLLAELDLTMASQRIHAPGRRSTPGSCGSSSGRGRGSRRGRVNRDRAAGPVADLDRVREQAGEPQSAAAQARRGGRQAGPASASLIPHRDRSPRRRAPGSPARPAGSRANARGRRRWWRSRGRPAPARPRAHVAGPPRPPGSGWFAAGPAGRARPKESSVSGSPVGWLTEVSRRRQNSSGFS